MQRGHRQRSMNSACALLDSAVESPKIVESAHLAGDSRIAAATANAALAFGPAIFTAFRNLLCGALNTSLRDAEGLQHMKGAPAMAEFPVQTGLRHLPR